jgi:hypothetical protein
MTNRLALFTFGGSFAKTNALLARPARLRHHKSLLLETMFPHLQFSLGFAGAVARPRLKTKLAGATLGYDSGYIRKKIIKS